MRNFLNMEYKYITPKYMYIINSNSLRMRHESIFPPHWTIKSSLISSYFDKEQCGRGLWKEDVCKIRVFIRLSSTGNYRKFLYYCFGATEFILKRFALFMKEYTKKSLINLNSSINAFAIMLYNVDNLN